MAHCVYLDDKEMMVLKQKNVFVAHCPESNTNLASGIAPIRKYLKRGISVGLGSDVAGGSTLNLLQAARYAIQASKLYWRLVDKNDAPLTVEEAFYLATKGGGAFFGKVGSFEPGYQMDAVVVDDGDTHTHNASSDDQTTLERLERCIYLESPTALQAKFVDGKCVYNRNEGGAL